MPTYSVTLAIAKPDLPGWNKMQLLIKATSHESAKRKAERQLVHLPQHYSALRSREVKPDHEREKWRRIWQRAYANMPVFLRTVERDVWRHDRTDIPVGEYIKLEAKGRIRKSRAGRQINYPYNKTWRTQRVKMLSRCLNYPQATRIGQFISVRVGLMRGTIPASTAKRELLKHLAGPNGQLIALKLLNREHLYDPEAFFVHSYKDYRDI